jgi:hypothetical protein
LLGSYEPAHAAESSPLAGFGQAQRTSCLMHSSCVACVGSLLGFDVPEGVEARPRPYQRDGRNVRCITVLLRVQRPMEALP